MLRDWPISRVVRNDYAKDYESNEIEEEPSHENQHLPKSSSTTHGFRSMQTRMRILVVQ